MMRHFSLCSYLEKFSSLCDRKKSPNGLFLCAVEGTRTLDLPRDRRAL